MKAMIRSNRQFEHMLGLMTRGLSFCSNMPFQFPPATVVNAALSSASASAQTPLLFAPGAALQAGSFAMQHLNVSPGSRCLVLTSPTGGTRAGSLLASLRRRGFAPLPLALPDSTPAASHASSAAGAARRAGATWVVGVGGSATIAVARGTAALLGGGSGFEVEPSGGSETPRILSLSVPFLSVPSCATGAEMARDVLLLDASTGLNVRKVHALSKQAAICDPNIATSLEGESAAVVPFALVAHALEIFLRIEGDAEARARAWLALEMAARALVWVAKGDKGGGGEDARAAVSAASVLVGAGMATGPLGPARGTALAVAARYAIGYSAALTALAPTASSVMLEVLLDKVEEEEEGGGGRRRLWRVMQRRGDY